jgi:hypothetical protein
MALSFCLQKQSLSLINSWPYLQHTSLTLASYYRELVVERLQLDLTTGKFGLALQDKKAGCCVISFQSFHQEKTEKKFKQ